MSSDYSWVTDDMFNEKLEGIVNDEGPLSMLAIPGVWEIVAEYHNNAVLEALDNEREAEEVKS